MADSARLKISEIFHSLQGEARSVGLRTVFVRLTGCPLRCRWCDTEYAFSGGNWLTVADIVDAVKQYQPRYVTVTGGEPLAQKDCVSLLSALCDADYQVSLETSGALDISPVDARVSRVMDWKPPSSGESGRNLERNIDALTANDQVKFVIANRTDYDWSVAQLQQHRFAQRCEVLFSPVQGEQNATELADWIIADKLPVRFQLQLHKLLWGDVAGK